MFAIVKASGRQFKVYPGQEVFLEKLHLNVDDNYVFNQVLAVNLEEDGKPVIVGFPFVKNATVEAKVLKQGKDKKIIVAKFKKRKKYRLKQGHRQLYTKILIQKINIA